MQRIDHSLRAVGREFGLAVDETVILLQPSLPSVGYQQRR